MDEKFFAKMNSPALLVTYGELQLSSFRVWHPNAVYSPPLVEKGRRRPLLKWREIIGPKYAYRVAHQV